MELGNVVVSHWQERSVMNKAALLPPVTSGRPVWRALPPQQHSPSKATTVNECSQPQRKKSRLVSSALLCSPHKQKEKFSRQQIGTPLLILSCPSLPYLLLPPPVAFIRPPPLPGPILAPPITSAAASFQATGRRRGTQTRSWRHQQPNTGRVLE
jgi:hypothetical protein